METFSFCRNKIPTYSCFCVEGKWSGIFSLWLIAERDFCVPSVRGSGNVLSSGGKGTSDVLLHFGWVFERMIRRSEKWILIHFDHCGRMIFGSSSERRVWDKTRLRGRRATDLRIGISAFPGSQTHHFNPAALQNYFIGFASRIEHCRTCG